MRIHGDLHVGQVLRSSSGELYVNDFDGDPLAADRTAPDAPARDVASMTCAIDHVGRVVARRHPEHAAAAAAWSERSRGTFLDAYRSGLGDRRALFDDRLLAPFEVAQEAHEFVYAARYLPQMDIRAGCRDARRARPLGVRAMMWQPDPEAFVRDLEAKPAALRALADEVGSDPWRGRAGAGGVS